MSTYLDMWIKIRELTEEQTEDWIRAVQPARGQSINFRGVRVVDVDVLEALRQFKELH
jgi:hypothetical protein